MASTIFLEVPPDFDFDFLLDTYLIYPWMPREGALVRPLRIGPEDRKLVVARMEPADSRLRVTLYADEPLDQADRRYIREELTRSLCLRPAAVLVELAADDPVIAAALQIRGKGTGKLYPDLFEALCGVVCAQRTNFARIYAMMQNLATRYGTPLPGPYRDDFAFPPPADLAAVDPDDIRECRVGFRAGTLSAVARWLAEQQYAWYDWRTLDPVAVPEMLTGIKGIGPYTSNLAVSLSYGHGGEPHVDTYVRRIIGTCYLNDPDASEASVRSFVTSRWQEHAETVIGLLTTDTEMWAETLGLDIGVRSGARVQEPSNVAATR
jgi:3-methyladenine DNA glycosylase/8-oxoguanine DNA glycosylase